MISQLKPHLVFAEILAEGTLGETTRPAPGRKTQLGLRETALVSVDVLVSFSQKETVITSFSEKQ